jgi:hypothetical protein
MMHPHFSSRLALGQSRRLVRRGVTPLINRPSSAFQVDDIQREFTRLKERGVVCTQEPTPMGSHCRHRALARAVKEGRVVKIHEAARSREPEAPRLSRCWRECRPKH